MSRGKVGRPKGAVNRELDSRIARAVEIFNAASIDGDVLTTTEVAESVGVSRSTLSRALSRPHVRELLLDGVRAALGGANVARAAARVSKLVQSGKSEYTQLEASLKTLAIAGFRPTDGGAAVIKPVVNVRILRFGSGPEPGAAVTLDERTGERLVPHESGATLIYAPEKEPAGAPVRIAKFNGEPELKP